MIKDLPSQNFSFRLNNMTLFNYTYLYAGQGSIMESPVHEVIGFDVHDGQKKVSNTTSLENRPQWTILLAAK